MLRAFRCSKIKEVKIELEKIKNTSEKEMWINELEELERNL